MRTFLIIGMALLLVSPVLAQSPLDHSKILEFPTIYIYPYYWILPIEGSISKPVPDSSPSIDIEDVCGDVLETGRALVLAF